jgi:hypothetical protein
VLVPAKGVREAAVPLHVDLMGWTIEFVENARLPEQWQAFSKIPLILADKHSRNNQSFAVYDEVLLAYYPPNVLLEPVLPNCRISAELRLATLVEDIKITPARAVKMIHVWARLWRQPRNIPSGDATGHP